MDLNSGLWMQNIAFKQFSVNSFNFRKQCWTICYKPIMTALLWLPRQNTHTHTQETTKQNMLSGGKPCFQTEWHFSFWERRWSFTPVVPWTKWRFTSEIQKCLKYKKYLLLYVSISGDNFMLLCIYDSGYTREQCTWKFWSSL